MDKTFKQRLEILPIKIIQHPVGDTEYYKAVHVKTLIGQADEEIANLTPQLQQQALPVVPEFVADAIAWDEQIDNSIAETLKNVFTFGDRGLKEAGLWIKNNPEKYIIARNIGYTVEKPQLFYLREKNTNYYLNKSKNNGLELVPNPYFDEDNQFTKQEIGSMETGSYELVPVEDGE